MKYDVEPSRERLLAIGLAIQVADADEERYLEDGVTYRSIIEHQPLVPVNGHELEGTPDGF